LCPKRGSSLKGGDLEGCVPREVLGAVNFLGFRVPLRAASQEGRL